MKHVFKVIRQVWALLMRKFKNGLDFFRYFYFNPKINLKKKFYYYKNIVFLYKEIIEVNLRTLSIGTFAGAITFIQDINAQQATVRVIPKDSQTQSNLVGVLVNVYDENGDFVDSGISTSNGVTFGLLTEVEDVRNKMLINFDGKCIEYNLTKGSTVKFFLTDILGKQYKLFENNENAGKHRFDINLSNLANGIYVIQAISDEFLATYIISKVDNNIYVGNSSNVSVKNKQLPKKFSKLDPGMQYKFVAISDDHFKDSVAVIVSEDMSLDILMDRAKNIHFMLYNNDTDSLDVGYVKVSGDSIFVNGEANIDVNYSDTLKFVAGILRNGENFSFLRTKKYLPEDLPDTIRSYVVDFALRDTNLVEVGVLNEEGLMTSYRFREFAKLIHFNYAAIGAIGSYMGNNGKFPDSLVISDTAFFYDTNTYGYMEENTKNRIVNVYNKWIRPFIKERDIPIITRNITYTGDGTHDFGYVVVVPSGSSNVIGASAIWRSLPATIEFGQTTLRSGPPYGDPGDEQGTRVTIQELWSCVFGYNPSVRNVDDIVLPSESVMHDAGTERPTIYDLKLVRITTSSNFYNNEKIDNILKIQDTE